MTAELRIVQPTSAHVEQLAVTMRAADRLEVEALGFESPRQALIASLEASTLCATALINGEVAALFGVAEMPGSHFVGRAAEAWLLTGAVVDRHPMTFWRASKVALPALITVFPRLINRVDARHLSALSYLRRLGAHVLPAVPHGVRGEPFHPVVLGVA